MNLGKNWDPNLVTLCLYISNFLVLVFSDLLWDQRRRWQEPHDMVHLLLGIKQNYHSFSVILIFIFIKQTVHDGLIGTQTNHSEI
jgi:hypothetical protein